MHGPGMQPGCFQADPLLKYGVCDDKLLLCADFQ